VLIPDLLTGGSQVVRKLLVGSDASLKRVAQQKVRVRGKGGKDKKKEKQKSRKQEEETQRKKASQTNRLGRNCK
jgi:hypothetical protein